MIGTFEGEHHFLSNFSRVGSLWPTLEHHFQALKAVNAADAVWVMATPDPGTAKKRGRSIVLRPDWDDIKDDLMYTLLWDKFKDDEARRLLLQTGDHDLVEGNWWGDKYWGVDIDTNEGYNMLGRLLMEVRNEIGDQ